MTFAKSFLAKFFLNIAKIEMESKFIFLIQKECLVDVYAAEYIRLSRFVPTLVANEADRARRFLLRLSFNIQNHLTAHQSHTYVDILTSVRT